MESSPVRRLLEATYLILAFSFQHVWVEALSFTNSFDGLTAGEPFNLTWTGASGTAALTLQNGTAGSFNTVNNIISGIKNSYVEWTPYPTTPTGQYVLRLQDSSNTAYSDIFTMGGPGTNPFASVLHFTNSNFDIQAGAPFNLTWEGAQGTTTLKLQQGDSNGTSDVDLIISGVKTPYVEWNPYSTVPIGQYVLRIDDTSGNFAFSTLFTMRGAGGLSSISSSSSSTTTTSSSSLTTSTKSSTSTSSTSTSSTTTTTSSSTTQTSSQSQTQTTHSTLPSASAVLTSGAVAGIASSCSLAGLAIIISIIALFVRRRHASSSSTSPSAFRNSGAVFNNKYFGLGGRNNWGKQRKFEANPEKVKLPQRMVVEIGDGRRGERGEMGRGGVSEMEGDYGFELGSGTPRGGGSGGGGR